MSQIHVESTEYVYLPVSGASALGDFEVFMVLLPEDEHPVAEDWVEAGWTGSDDAGWKARVLVGPDSGGQTLTAGTYVPWIKISADTETVVMTSGPIDVV